MHGIYTAETLGPMPFLAQVSTSMSCYRMHRLQKSGLLDGHLGMLHYVCCTRVDFGL